VLAGIVLWAASGGPPTVAGWEQGWRETYGALPTLQELAVEDPGPVCDDALGMIRTATAEYTEAPNDDLRDAFLVWSEYAESVFFECPPHDGTGPGFAAAYEEIDRLAAEIDALLAFERDLPEE
jgi:hypothetical protein